MGGVSAHEPPAAFVIGASRNRVPQADGTRACVWKSNSSFRASRVPRFRTRITLWCKSDREILKYTGSEAPPTANGHNAHTDLGVQRTGQGLMSHFHGSKNPAHSNGHQPVEQGMKHSASGLSTGRRDAGTDAQPRPPDGAPPQQHGALEPEPNSRTGDSSAVSERESISVTPDDYLSDLPRSVVLESLRDESLKTLLSPLPRPARLRIILMGKPASGKGTQAPLIARRFGMVHISLGTLLRNEIRSNTELGRLTSEYVHRGELVPDDLALAILKKRLSQEDCRNKGFILDGFPRTERQAVLLNRAGIEIDYVIVLERPDEDLLDWARERLLDPITGIMYHPRLAPPPPHVVHRLERRCDDKLEIVHMRLRQYAQEAPKIMAQYSDRLSIVRTDNARPYLDTFREISEILERLILPRDDEEKCEVRLERTGLWRPRGIHRVALPRGALFKALDSFAHRIRERDYVPLYASTAQDAPRIGLVGRNWAAELLSADTDHEVFDIQLETCSVFDASVTTDSGFVRFHDDATTERLLQVMQRMRDRGLIEGWRNERVPLRLGNGRYLEIERACMPYLGIETSGVHINGYFYKAGQDGRPELFVWLARRSWKKPTYPGRLDQLTAGGVPAAATSVLQQVMLELYEEAAYVGPAPVPVGCVRYRYETRKGISAKVLYLYDLELEENWKPYNHDGEVDAFYAVSAEEALASLVEAQHEWKPNSALVLVDFLVRHGVLHADNEPDYADIITRLHCCGI
jgi:adenylate kinase